MLPQLNPRRAGFAELRLAVVSPFVDRRHGTERALAELLERLARDYGWEIHLYAQHLEDLRLDDPKTRTSSQSGGIFWRKVPAVPGPHLIQFCGWLCLSWICRFWDRRIRGVRCDLVFSPGINCLDADFILVHAMFHKLAEMARHSRTKGLRELHRKAYYRLLCFLEGRIYSNPRVALAAVSKHSAEQLRQYFDRSDVAVIPNGVDTALFNPDARNARRHGTRERLGLSPAEHVLLLIGNDWKTKGLNCLLQAVADCCDLPLRLLVVGKEDPAEWAELISKLKIAGRVMFLEHAANVLDFYAAADIYVAPSLEDSFNLPALEAMACGIPAIVSSSAGISEWIYDGVDGLILRDPRNAQELAAALRTLVLDSAFMQRIGGEAALVAATLSWDSHAQAIHGLLLKSATAQAG